MKTDFKSIVEFVKTQYPDSGPFIALHEPYFGGNEKAYLTECIETRFVSSVGQFVDRFERAVAEFTGAGFAVATVNGTAALHVALGLAGTRRGDEVLTQAVTFIATANAISYCGALPVFLDSDPETLGLSPEALDSFLSSRCENRDDGFTYNRRTGRRVSACVCMHVFGHPVKIEALQSLCDRYHIALVEDAAESLGSTYRGRHTGTFGTLGVLSFNGNKTITTGGGGMILTDQEHLGRTAKHITTTAKRPHAWEYVHDCIGFNYRMPNINAALGCAQMEQLPRFLENKRALARAYRSFFEAAGIRFVCEPEHSLSNYWLNAIVLSDRAERDAFLEYSNRNGVMTRPLWRLIPKLEIYSHCETDGLETAAWLEDRLVNLPSGVRL